MVNNKIKFHAKAIFREIKENNIWGAIAFCFWAFGTLVVFGAMIQMIDPIPMKTAFMVFTFFGIMSVLFFNFTIQQKEEK